MKELQGKKPIGLAVTLVILVMSIMLNIVFVTKNIGYKQQIQVTTGKQIVAELDALYVKSEQLKGLLEQLQQQYHQDSPSYSLLQKYAANELEQLSKQMSELFRLTVSINDQHFSEQAKRGEAKALEELAGQLEALMVGDGDGEEYISLVRQANETVNQIYDIVSGFNFKAVLDVKSAMIRMSNGFIWPETVLELDKAVNG